MDFTYVSEMRVKHVQTSKLLEEILWRYGKNSGAFTGEDARLARELSDKLNQEPIQP